MSHIGYKSQPLDFMLYQDGTNGKSQVVLEIENDFDSIPCTYDGEISETYDYATQTLHKLRLYEGTDPVKFKVLSTRPTSDNTEYVVVYSKESGLTANLSNRTTASAEAYEAEITKLDAKVDKAKINYTVYKGTNETVLATGAFTAEKRYAGDPSVDYYVLADRSQVMYDLTADTYEPETVKFTFWKQTAGQTPEPLTDTTFKYSYTSGADATAGKVQIPSTGYIEVSIKGTTIVSLYTSNEVLLDTETVSVLSNGSNGRSIINSTRYYTLSKNKPNAPTIDPAHITTEEVTKDNVTWIKTEFIDNGVTWSKSPPAYSDEAKADEKMYYETVLTIYDAVDSTTNKAYTWSDPVKQTVLDVDYIKSIAVTTDALHALEANINNLRVTDTSTGQLILKADGREENEREEEMNTSRVQLGGFTVTTNKLTAGSGNGFVSLQTTEDSLNYTPAEYIESNGHQYINTGIKYDSSKTYVTKLKIAYTTTEPTNQICGFSGNRGCGIGTTINSWWEYNYSTDGAIDVVYPNTIYELEWTKGANNAPGYYQRKVNGRVFSEGNDSLMSITGTSLLLLACSDEEASNGYPDYKCHAKLYSCQIYENGNIIRNFIPVFKNGEFGLYDTCFGQFYKNQGTGKLSGAFNNETADTITLNGERYTRLDYIQNNGTNNYIEIPNLEITKANGFEVEVELEPTADVTPDDRCCIFSNYSTANSANTGDNISLEIHRSSTQVSQNQARLYADSKECVNANGVLANQKNKLKFSYKLGKGSCTINNTTITGSATVNSGSTWTGPFRIFVDNYNGGRFSTFNVPMKLYSMKIWSGGIKLAHYLPAINNNGIPGLINLVNGDFRPNASGTRFTYGEYEAKTGTIFTKGENSYRTLNYIETHPTSVTNGNYRVGQYIRTGYTMDYSKGDSFEITAQATNAIQNGFFFGNFGGNWGAMYHTHSSGNGHKIAFFTSTLGILETGLTSDDTSKHTYKVTGTAMYVDGNLTSEIKENNMTTSSEALIGTATNGTDWWYYSGRIYGCRIWRGTELRRDFIPVIKNEAEYGLYDLVTDNFYENSGTGSFTGKGHTTKFTAFYLGAPDPETAPFSITNTGRVKADAGTVGGFTIQNTLLTSNPEVQLSAISNSSAEAQSGVKTLQLSPDALRIKNDLGIGSFQLDISPETGLYYSTTKLKTGTEEATNKYFTIDSNCTVSTTGEITAEGLNATTINVDNGLTTKTILTKSIKSDAVVADTLFGPDLQSGIVLDAETEEDSLTLTACLGLDFYKNADKEWYISFKLYKVDDNGELLLNKNGKPILCKNKGDPIDCPTVYMRWGKVEWFQTKWYTTSYNLKIYSGASGSSVSVAAQGDSANHETALSYTDHGDTVWRDHGALHLNAKAAAGTHGLAYDQYSILYYYKNNTLWKKQISSVTNSFDPGVAVYPVLLPGGNEDARVPMVNYTHFEDKDASGMMAVNSSDINGVDIGNYRTPFRDLYVRHIYLCHPTKPEKGYDFRKLYVNKNGTFSNDLVGKGSADSTASGTASTECFDPGTPVVLADGTTKNIEQIVKGDEVKSYNPITKTIQTSKVVNTISHLKTQELIKLTFEDGTEIFTTMQHPFYTTSGWVSLKPWEEYTKYEDLKDALFELMQVGQEFYKITPENKIEFVKLTRIQYRHGVEDDHIVYNLDVDNCNTYFVNNMLVHNK